MGLRNAIISVAIAIFIAALAFHFNNPTLKTINLIAWVVADFFVYSGAFGYVNNLDLSNDLTYWVMRIVGGLIGVIGLFFGGLFFFAGLASNMDPISIGIGILLLGLFLLAAFIELRGKRRATGLYIWK